MKLLVPKVITSKALLESKIDLHKSTGCILGWGSSPRGNTNCFNIRQGLCGGCIFSVGNFTKEIFKEYVIDTGKITKAELLDMTLSGSCLLL